MGAIRFVVFFSIGLVVCSIAGAAATPPGRLLFMVGDRQRGEARLHVVNGDGTGRREVALFQGEWPFPPSFSPDATRFAYLCSPGLCVRSVGDTSTEVVARSARGANVHAFAWSPDARGFVFVRGGVLWRVSAAGGRERRLARLPGREVTVAWSPRGSFLALTRAGTSRTAAIYVARPDGSGLRRLVRGTGISSAPPSWSHDERLLAYGAGAWVHVVDVRTGRRTRFVRGIAPKYSPADRRLFVTRYNADQDAVLFVVDARGRERRLYTFAHDPAWSPDGREIADGVVGRLFATDVRTGRRRALAPLPVSEFVFFLDWAREA